MERLFFRHWETRAAAQSSSYLCRLMPDRNEFRQEQAREYSFSGKSLNFLEILLLSYQENTRIFKFLFLIQNRKMIPWNLSQKDLHLSVHINSIFNLTFSRYTFHNFCSYSMSKCGIQTKLPMYCLSLITTIMSSAKSFVKKSPFRICIPMPLTFVYSEVHQLVPLSCRRLSILVILFPSNCTCRCSYFVLHLSAPNRLCLSKLSQTFNCFQNMLADFLHMKAVI